jgi:hypothetical protein
MSNIPVVPENSFRVTIELHTKQSRLDNPLLEALRAQNDHLTLREISRNELKGLFQQKKVHIKGQPAKPSSALAAGTTYVDILGFGKK